MWREVCRRTAGPDVEQEPKTNRLEHSAGTDRNSQDHRNTSKREVLDDPHLDSESTASNHTTHHTIPILNGPTCWQSPTLFSKLHSHFETTMPALLRHDTDCKSGLVHRRMSNLLYGTKKYVRYLLATPVAFGSLCACFMWSMRASPPRNNLWQSGQAVAFGPPMRAACCCNTGTRSCTSWPQQQQQTNSTRFSKSVHTIMAQEHKDQHIMTVSSTRVICARHQFYGTSLGCVSVPPCWDNYYYVATITSMVNVNFVRRK